MSKWLIPMMAAALVSCAVADDGRAAVAAARDVEVVAAGRGWRCSAGGPVVSGGDLSGYACEGNGGAGKMEPLSMVRYIRGAEDWAFGGEIYDDWGELARVRVSGDKPVTATISIVITDEDEGVCQVGERGEVCRPISKQAREAILEAGEEIGAELRARFNALKKKI